MDSIYLRADFFLSPKYRSIPKKIAGLHSWLLAKCALEENRGIIIGARKWKNVEWIKYLGDPEKNAKKLVDGLVANGLAVWTQSGDLELSVRDGKGRLFVKGVRR